MGAGIVSSYYLALYSSLTESRADDYAVHILQQFAHVIGRHMFAVDELRLHLVVIVGAGVCQTLQYALVGILQVIFAHQTYAHYLLGIAPALQEVAPWTQLRFLAHGDVQFPQDGSIQPLILHGHRHLVYAGHIFALYHALQFHVAEVGHLLAHIVAQVMLGAQHQYVGLDTLALELLHAALGGLGLQLSCCMQIGNIGQMHVHGVLPKLPSQLSDGLQEGGALDIAYRSAYLCDDEVELLVVAEQLYVTLHLVGDVRHHLYGLAQIIAPALLLYHVLVDAPGGDVVGLGGLYAGEAFVVAQVEVRLQTIYSHVTLPMLIGIKCSGVDVDVRVKLLDSDVVASGLQQFAYRRGDYTLAQR